MRYAIRHWPGLVAFLDDGRIEMDSNTIERTIKAAYIDAQEIHSSRVATAWAHHWSIAMTARSRQRS